MLRIATAALLGAAAFCTPALAGDQDFRLVNKTGYQIDEVYVSRSASQNWGNDVMGRDSLSDNESVKITINAPGNVCRWDLKVKYNDGDKAEWTNLNLCNISKVTLYWNRRNQTTRAVTE